MSEATVDESYRECSVPTLSNSLYQPPPFQANMAIHHLHSLPFRFGHSRDINLWIQGSNEEQADYLKGLFAASIALICIFVCWMIMLWIFKCLGPTKVGFFSARRIIPEKPHKPDAVRKQERKSIPFQHNGVATDPAAAPVRKKSILKPVVTAPLKVAQAPIRIASKARKKKRELEKRNQFEKFQDSSGDDDDDDETESEEQPDSGANITVSASGVLTDDEHKIIREYEQNRKEYERQIYSSQDRIRRIRIGAGFCACAALISAIMFTIMGEKYFIDSFQKFESGLDKANSNIEAALEATAGYLQRQTSAKESTRKFLTQIDGICPTAATSLCSNTNIDDATSIEDLSCDFTNVPFGPELTDVVTQFVSTLRTIEADVGDLQSDLLETKDLLDEANKYFPEIGTKIFWSAVGCSLALGGICMFLAGGVVYLEITKENGKERPLPKLFANTRSYLMVPLVFLLVTVSCFLSVSFVFIGLGSSDLCYNTPDEAVLNLLETQDDNFHSIVYSFTRYSISGCPAGEAPPGLELAIQSIQESVIPAMAALSDTVQNQGVEFLDDECGADVGALLAVLSAVGERLCLLGLTMTDVRKSLQCDDWNPIYVTMMHEAICDSATQGLMWAASTQISLLLFSLMLLTLRVAYYETTEVLENEDQPIGGCCLCFRWKSPSGETGATTTAMNTFKPSNEIRAGWSCFGCCGPVIPMGHIGEINIKKQGAPQDMTPSIPIANHSSNASTSGPADTNPNISVRNPESGEVSGMPSRSRASGSTALSGSKRSSKDSYIEEDIF